MNENPILAHAGNVRQHSEADGVLACGNHPFFLDLSSHAAGMFGR